LKDAGCRVKKVPRRPKPADCGKALIVKLQIGAGIVAESRPDREYIETAKKMNTMLGRLVLLDLSGETLRDQRSEFIACST
jgi:hypothetical protein